MFYSEYLKETVACLAIHPFAYAKIQRTHLCILVPSLSGPSEKLLFTPSTQKSALSVPTAIICQAALRHFQDAEAPLCLDDEIAQEEGNLLRTAHCLHRRASARPRFFAEASLHPRTTFGSSLGINVLNLQNSSYESHSPARVQKKGEAIIVS